MLKTANHRGPRDFAALLLGKIWVVLETYVPPVPASSAHCVSSPVCGQIRIDYSSRGLQFMPEVIFTGAAGRIEGRYHPARQKNAPIGIVLHPHPQFGGTMNHQIIYQLYYAFVHRNFSVLRFNFRGVGRSQGSFDHGQGELSDAASALDWAQSINPEARSCWIAGFSFGAWIGMQLLMRRPEIEGFIDRPARESLRLFLSRSLPFLGHDCSWRQRRGRAAQRR
jgi:pimeloyl-ACP methyl ester carboxylesterase